MSKIPVQLTHAFTHAVDVARILHAHEPRKGTAIPYLSHVLAVAALVLEHGGSETQAIAALLHDTAEDHGGEARLAMIRAEFGEDVAVIVRACSDSLGAKGEEKEPWWPRKVRYLAQLEHEPAAAVLVSAADKLHNARAILADYRSVGEALWERFNADPRRGGTLWYYTRLAEILGSRLTAGDGLQEALARELADTVQRLTDRVAEHDAAVHREIEDARKREKNERTKLGGSPAGQHSR